MVRNGEVLATFKMDFSENHLRIGLVADNRQFLTVAVPVNDDGKATVDSYYELIKAFLEHLEHFRQKNV